MTMPAVVREAKYIKSDVDQNNNKYWYITEYDNMTCVVNYGRVGNNGQSKTHTFHAQTAAASFFDKKCREKEGERKGYRPLQVINGSNGVNGHAVAQHDLARVASEQIQTDSPQTQALLRYLTKANVHNILSATTMKYDVDKGLFSTPCGIVTKDGIDQARALLAQIGDFVAGEDFWDPRYKTILNDYLMLIPQKVGRKLNPATLYPDLDAVQRQNDILDSLDASLQAVLSRPSADGKPAEVGRLFEVKLERVNDAKEIARIRKKYRSTLQAQHVCAHLDVKTVYAVEIAAMERAYEEKGQEVGNVMELWHGTRAANLLSILKSGFLIPPSNAPHCTGRMFGNGVYFSDQSTKSLNYAYGYWGGGAYDSNCFMFLVEVAMGRYYVPRGPDQDLPKPGYDSTFAKAGESGVGNNEMIVYKTWQINPNYLVEFGPSSS
jgi:poly [ADP-ribose] polymerase